MAGRGPSPKAIRRRANAPSRGDWVELPSVVAAAPKPVRSWPARTKRAWASWCCDPASSRWTPADRSSVVELGHLHAELVRGHVSLAGEIRLRMDSLGLTQKGKRDLRWRVADEPVVVSGPVAVMAHYRRMVEAGADG